MAKQTIAIAKQCQHKSQCSQDAKIGVYHWSGGETDVDLNSPIRVFCGQHKPLLKRNTYLRNVQIKRAVA